MTDLRSESVEIAKAIRDAAKDYQVIDVLMDDAGNVFVTTPGARFIGRYTDEANARSIASDILYLLKRI